MRKEFALLLRHIVMHVISVIYEDRKASIGTVALCLKYNFIHLENLNSEKWYCHK